MRVFRTAKARKDIADIWHYVAADSRAAADRHSHQLSTQFAFLADNPNAGRVRTELAADLRSWPIGNYVIFYRPLPGQVVIVRVLHRSRDLGREAW